MRILLPLTLVALLSNLALAQFTYESILSEGTVYKIEIDESGIYKLDKNFVNSLNISGSDLANLAIYGQAGGIVPQANDDPNAVDDLAELATLRIGLGDGSWDDGDAIIFYAEGANAWKTDSENGTTLDHNIYDTNNYYYLKTTLSPLSIEEGSVSTSDVIYDEYTRYQRYEEDNFNILAESTTEYPSGQEWYGDIFKNTRSRTYSDRFDFTGIVIGSDCKIFAKGAIRSDITSTINLDINNSTSSDIGGTINYGNSETKYADPISIVSNITATGPLSIDINFPMNGDSEATFWLDYIEIESQHELAYTGDPIRITHRSMADHTKVGFAIAGSPSDLRIWNINNHHSVTQLNTSQSGSTTIGYDDNNGEFASYIAFDIQNINKTPTLVGQSENQNLHAIERADMVIVYEKTFIDQAEELAEHRRTFNNFIVETVDIDQIWEEFSAGKIDPSGLRNFFKMLYQRDPSFRFALLMGDGSYDPRAIKVAASNNFIPVYEKKQSLQPIYSFPTDDYYALLDLNEGTEGSIALEGDLDISIGRFPVNTAEEAAGMVKKIIHYETSPDRFGDWRSSILFAADDGNGTLHVSDSDGIARSVKSDMMSELRQTKVFFDAYNQVSTPGGERYPEATSDIFNDVQRGQLITCYLGHGGPKGWAQERVLQVEQINDWSNLDNMTVMITATCSFAGYDDPGLVSAGEHAILNPNGGVVALLTTVRSVFTSANEALTRQTWESLLTNGDPNMTIGEAFAEAKSSFTSSTTIRNSRKYTLLGDPAMKLAIPRYEVTPQALNDIELGSAEADTLLSALERGTITGVITDPSVNTGEVIENFNGEMLLSIYDKESEINTLVNDDDSAPFSFSAQNTLLFKGKTEVVNGRFTIDFVLPQNIKFDIGKGQLYFYATDLDQQIDADGQYDQLYIGDSLPDELSDSEGPEIDLFMNTYAFLDGGMTDQDPILIASLFDESGINLSNTSIGHDLKATLDDDSNQSYVVNEFYEGSIDDYRKGEVRYPFRDLALGYHTVELTAWDILNNSSTAELSFVVSDGSMETLVNVINYPNPSTSHTNFGFEHDGSAGESLITISIFDTSGKNVDILQYNRPSEGSREVDLGWEHREKNILEGIYLYQIEMLDLESNTTKTSDLQKLIIVKN